MTGTVMGTVGYMSPEQLRGEQADARSDIFALGCVLYEMLAGSQAFARASAAETTSAILTDDPEPLAGSEIDRLVGRCLEKLPQRRFQSASDLAFALRQITGPGPAPVAADDKPSIAVLPFGNLSGDPAQEYFCDGMAEEIINALAHVDGLRVVARTSSFAFKGRHQDIRQIGDNLGVMSILEGSVRKAGDRLRITAQLISVSDGYHLWSERFDRTLEDVFSIQDEISLAIVDQLKVELLGDERAGIVKRSTENLEAYNAYLKGIFQWNRLTPEGYARSLECFLEAVELDDGYAPAYAQLAIWYLSQAFWGAVSPTELMPRSIEFAERALEIDSTLPEAHSFRGVVRTFFQRDGRNGERDLRRAAELGPNMAVCHSNLAALLTGLRRREEAIEAALAAQRLDPLSPTTNAWSCWWIGLNGRVEAGINDAKKLIAHQPDHWLPHHVLGDLLFRAERFDDAIAATERAIILSDHNSISVTQLSIVKYLVGATEEADRLLDQLEERWREAYVPPTFFSWICRARSDWERTLEWLDRADRVNDPWLPFHWLVGPMPAASPEITATLKQYELS
jgi:serine/threonine-protein kinase